MTATPINVQPPNNGQVPTDFPELLATVAYDELGASEEVTVTWNVASDSGFTTDLQAVTTATSYRSGQAASAAIPAQLSAGVWYVRARSTMGGVNSAWSTTNTFTIDHHPYTANHIPSHSSKVAYGDGTKTFSWTFGDADPSDDQTAYQVRMYRAADDTLIFDTGKTTSTDEEHTVAISATYDSDYVYWQVKVWDTYDIPSPWSSAIMFKLGLEPVVYVTAPVIIADSPSPTVSWVFTTGNDQAASYDTVGDDYTDYDDIDATEPTYTDLLQYAPNSAEQAAYRVVVKYGNTIVHDSDWIAGTESSYVLPAIIHFDTTYTVQVYVRDTSDFEGVSSPQTFTGIWTKPDAIMDVVIDTAFVDDPAVGGVHIYWNAENHDPTFLEWRVYRRVHLPADRVFIQGGDADDIPAFGTPLFPWELVGTNIYTSGNGYVYDFLFTPGESYDYAVVQVADRFGAAVESEFVMGAEDILVTSQKYWLFVGVDPDTAGVFPYKMMLPSVTSDSFTEVYEQRESNVIGRGRRLEYGTRFGYQGTLSTQLRGDATRTPAAQRQQLEFIKYVRETAWLRIPFGYILKVAIGDLQITRLAGVGMSEFVDVGIPYSEVV